MRSYRDTIRLLLTFVADHPRDTPDVYPGDGVGRDDEGACSLRAAVMEANAHCGHDVVDLPDHGDAYRLDSPYTWSEETTTDLDTTAALVRELASQHVDRRRAGIAIDGLLGAALADELLRPREEGEPAEDDLLAGYDGEDHEWGPIVLEKSTEIADLILLDPVHDVTEGGWPNARG